MSVRNILNRMLLKGDFVQIFGKIINKIVGKNKISPGNMKWLQENAIEVEDFLKDLDPSLWQEAVAETNIIRTNAEKTLKDIEYDLGGGGAYDLLYFLVRYLRPRTIVETGVAAGYSSYACLQAIRANKEGRLLSSDFPYFRLPDPENYIGIIIPEELKNDWSLFIEGDRKNFVKILGLCDEIDLLHYDSDKSYAGRAYALSLLAPRLTDRSVILMDDIEDNNFFFDFVEKKSLKNVQVFRFENKYLAMWWGDKVEFCDR
jgi:predicted O-methyltransferase YrrM